MAMLGALAALSRQDAFALQALALQLAIAADGFRPLARPFLARLLVMTPELHLAEDAFALHLLFQRLQRLVDIVVANDDLQRRLLLADRMRAGSYQKAFFLSTSAF